MVGDFHAHLTLDDSETVRLVFPESQAMLTASANASLLSDTQSLLAGQFETGGEYTMNVVEAHTILSLLPLSIQPCTNHRTIMMHKPTPYDLPSLFNHLTIRWPGATTRTALLWHACLTGMQRTQRNSTGMTIRKDSLNQLDSLLPCSSCIAGKMWKSQRAVPHSYIDLKALTSQLLCDEKESLTSLWFCRLLNGSNNCINEHSKQWGLSRLGYHQ